MIVGMECSGCTCGTIDKNAELRRVVEHHLKIPQQVRDSKIEYWVRHHHWNRVLVMERLINNPSKGTKKQRLSTLMTRTEAERYGITDDINQFKLSKNKKEVLFMASPNNPPSAVKDFLA
jgi:hypothetical protein